MKNLSYINLIAFLTFCLVCKGQNIPFTANEIPLFPGAMQNMEAQKLALKDYQEIYEGESLSNLQVSVYCVKTVPDDVCRFYIEKLGAKEGFPEDNTDFQNPEKNTKPWYEVGLYDESLFEDQYEGDIKIHDGKWFKAALSERKQWVNGEWLQGSYFEWTVRLNNGEWARHFIDIIDDDSFDSRAKTVNNKTMITIVSQIKNPDNDED
ncbi:MAG: hypothetical protein JXA77_03670 [Bacteroidales bacterium]|nr:hypothetical protein [Bacteroidales bacterium]MBN2818470.1 hypothetical protein [Bacteroidales bacterium]